MSPLFDFERIVTTEFGVGLDDFDRTTFVTVPVNGDVQDVLSDMARSTWYSMQEMEDDPAPYQAGEKYGSSEYLVVSANSNFDDAIRELHAAGQLTVNANALGEPDRVFCYFARFMDNQDRRLTAMRRASQFKGLLKPRKIRLVSDALVLVEDDIFKLDTDFDLLIDSEMTHILRPSSFEHLCHLKKEILRAVPNNVASIQRDLPFVDLEGVGRYAAIHSRAARYLASIRSHDLAGISRGALVGLCSSTGVEVDGSNGRIVVSDGHVMGFLEVLDRRRYEVELVAGRPEQFKAASRRRIER